MNGISARDVVAFTDGYLLSGDIDTVFTGVSTDSRSIGPGELFVALRGERFNGHAYVSQALERGAAGAVVMEEIPRAGGVIISVEDSLQALGDIAAGVRGRHDVAIVGVTGSTGKTTVKELCASILSLAGPCLKTEKNYNNLVGVPLTLLSLRPDHEFAVIEMGTNRFGEIDRLSSITRPLVSIITNINPVHLSGLRSISGIIREKQAIFRNTAKCGCAVINPSLEYMDGVEIPPQLQRITFSHTTKADISLTGIRHRGLDGSDIDVDLAGKPIQVHVPLPGMHNVINALGACACAVALNMDPEVIAEGIRTARFPGMRSEIVISDHLTIINDCYNANPASMKAALSMLAESPHTFKVAVLGDMLELGGDAAFWHEELGRWVAAFGIDRLVCIGEMADVVCSAAVAAGMAGRDVFRVHTKSEILHNLQDVFDKDAMVLVKASRALELDQVVNQLKQVA
ncbi:MAG TPA: UDP-N-acetylmuramoyl-tripeptide--D-alanyl-D-alanine ligase [Deltaproteobacteria bacterium]|mgnify:CR=1|nr:UDP-N-acetylmuramoyl-tripeptide--D-alanyl-D-alanine ligase [Deltaproteobacteria bacterium]HOM28905.1 UDP-N-acetylmuramoyl-tripeptide--D-alanyl-D-alanine ligase [Deltaproteobacteria bacterium]HPP80164.1 UDP-N-acetylmuramoyl-tripeptide--D-alanyl-D-alanine ligase [Deltaproteobacteria bacterium]